MILAGTFTNIANNPVVHSASDNGFIVMGMAISGVIAADDAKAATIVALIAAIACIDQYYMYKQQKGQANAG